MSNKGQRDNAAPPSQESQVLYLESDSCGVYWPTPQEELPRSYPDESQVDLDESETQLASQVFCISQPIHGNATTRRPSQPSVMTPSRPPRASPVSLPVTATGLSRNSPVPFVRKQEATVTAGTTSNTTTESNDTCCCIGSCRIRGAEQFQCGASGCAKLLHLECYETNILAKHDLHPLPSNHHVACTKLHQIRAAKELSGGGTEQCDGGRKGNWESDGKAGPRDPATHITEDSVGLVDDRRQLFKILWEKE